MYTDNKVSRLLLPLFFSNPRRHPPITSVQKIKSNNPKGVHPFLSKCCTTLIKRKMNIILTETRSDKGEMTVKAPELPHVYQGLGTMEQSNSEMQ